MEQPFLQTNRERWDELARVHARTAFYDLEGFKAGKSSLRPVEVEELGDVAGKSLLHLQCHFGLDTLSWARRGARVTGVDFSAEAVALARALARELGLTAEFVCSDIYDLRQALPGTFDVVFTSYGVLCWLPDVKRWAETVAHFLKEDGTFYMVEIHPLVNVFDDTPGAGLRVAYPYFAGGAPLREDRQGTYADHGARLEHTVSYQWGHGLGDVLTALLGAGLRLEFVHEFPYCVCGILPCMEQGADGWWRLPGAPDRVPLLFSLKAARSPTSRHA
jgi:SAM-dependent methyltransferase